MYRKSNSNSCYLEVLLCAQQPPGGSGVRKVVTDTLSVSQRKLPHNLRKLLQLSEPQFLTSETGMVLLHLELHR